MRILLLAFALSAGLAAQTIQVPATADPWQAGGYMIPPWPYSPGSLPGEGSVPPEIDFPAASGQIITISAYGIWSCGNDSSAGPGGGVCQPYPTVDVAPFGGISGIEVAPMTLAGVFLDAINPPNVIQEGGIGTVFAIGTGGVFPVPPNATRLILGMPDECDPTGPPIQPSCYGDNAGQVTVVYKIWKGAGLLISQTSSSPGSKIELAGFGFAPEEMVELYVNAIGSTPVASPRANSSGSFFAEILAPQEPYGAEEFFAVGLRSGSLGVTSSSVVPLIATKPTSGLPGATIASECLGFGANESVQISWNSPRILLATVTTTASGSCTQNIVIPSNAATGTNGLIGVGETTGAVGLGSVTVK